MGTRIRHDAGERVLEGELRYEATPWAWGPAEGGCEVDGSWHVLATIERGSRLRQRVEGWAHTRLALDGEGRVAPLEARFVEQLVALAFENDKELGGPVDGYLARVGDFYPHGDGELCHTRAPRYCGAAMEALSAALALPSDGWMQDWPLEVADTAKIPAAVALDEGGDEDLRFDAVSFVFYSLEYSDYDPGTLAWLEATLRRDFTLHGHTAFYWACVDGFLPDGSPDPDRGFPVLTPLARRALAAALVRLEMSP